MAATAGMGFYLDREGHNTFLRVVTNQELEKHSTELTTQFEDKTKECGHWYTETHSYERKLDAVEAQLEEVEAQLKRGENDRDH